MEFTLDQALQKGIEAHKAGKVQEADRYYTAILQAQPKHPDANHNMGVLAVGVGKVEEALPFFKTALEVTSDIAQYWLSYINALIKLDRLDDAKAVLNQAKSNGEKGDGFDQLEKRLGSSTFKNSNLQKLSQKQLQSLISLYTQGQHQQALTQASQLLKEFPNDINLYNIIGISNKHLGQLAEAIKAYKKTIAINPDYADGYFNMGITLQEQGKLKEAIEVYKKAISINPDYAVAYNNMGNALQEQGSLKEAIQAYNKALELKPDYAEAYNNMGNAYQEQGKLEEAIEAFAKAISFKSDFAEAYNNMGNALKEQDKLNAAITAYKKAISIKPNFANAYYNIGTVLKEQDKLNAAITAYKKAISIKPNFANAYNNMGIVISEQGNPEEAIKVYKKALDMMPDHVKTHINMGNALQEQGKLREAIDSFKKAISNTTDYTVVWKNLYFPLKALKSQIGSNEDLTSFYPEVPNSIFNQIESCLLDYKLDRGTEREGVSIGRVLKKLSSAENITIQNPKFNENSDKQRQLFPDEVVALVHFGRSGTGLIHSLIDGHPEVSTLPSTYFSEYFDHSNWEQIISGGWDGMVDRFIATYDVLFDATSSVPIETLGKKLKYQFGIKEGMANVGDQKDEVLSVDRNLFGAELKRLMASYNQLDAFVFFKLVHKAYDKAINDTQQKSMIFYHIHNPDTCAQLNFLRFAPNTKWLVIVREPIQSLESWLKSSFAEKNYHEVVAKISHMLNEVGNPIFQNEKSIGVRLEDLKEFPQKTTAALCAWFGIKEADSLYEMTAQGKKWWGNPASPDYSKDGMNPFGKVSINRKLGLILSENDQFILRTLFYPFSVRFGYVVESLDQFKLDLEVIRPMLDQMFDFEKKIASRIGTNLDSFDKSASYLYLRSQLLERWKILSKYHTYPNMIEPLKIN